MANATEANLATALAHARAGIPIFPAHVARRVWGWMKKPAVTGWRVLATTDENQIRDWWRQFPSAVPGIELEQAGLVVVDPDRHGDGPDGLEAFAQLCADIGGLPVHPTTDTPSGHHHIFRQNGRLLGNSSGGLPPAVDIRGVGGWIVAPGAIRSDGAVYAPHPGTPTLVEAFRSKAIPPLPKQLAAIIAGESGGTAQAARNTADARDQRHHGDLEHLDVDAALAAMGPTGAAVNDTQMRVILALLQKALHPDDVVAQVVDATMTMAAHHRLGWTRDREVKEVTNRLKGSLRLLHKEYDPDTGTIPPWLAGEFHNDWVAELARGRRPILRRNLSRWYVCSYERGPEAAEDRNTQAEENGDGNKPKSGRGPFVLRPFVPFDLAALPPREWLYGKHYQRRTVSATIAPGGFGKTTLCMVEAIAMATCRNLLGEQPEERLRVWFHNGEDSLEELHRRIGAICLHYNIPQGELAGWLFVTSGSEVPLRVAKGYSSLEIDERLKRQITEAVGDNAVDVAILDPLVTLHGVPESDNMKMYAVVSIFAGIADACSCGFELAHHTRKMQANGGIDYTVDDMRGASSIRDAVRAARMLNHMSATDADLAGVPAFERTSYFRVDRVKANNAAPAKIATWRRFINVDLPNGDEVGVVEPWEFPGQGAQTPEKAAAEQKAEQLFLRLLDQYTAEGNNVSNRSGPNYAPKRFAQERAAKAAGVSKAALIVAMQNLLTTGRIKSEPYGRGDRDWRRLVRGIHEPEDGSNV